MSIKISIITVCKNSVNTIRDTIDSVLFQQYPALEYIIIDGASTDGTLDYILKYGSKIDHVISESDDGIYEGMNKGISLANGDLIGFLNSDDCYSNNNVLNQVARVFEEESIMACYAQLCYVDFKNTDRVVRYWESSSFRPFDFKKGWCPPHPTFFVRKRVYEQYGYFNLDYRIAADVELMIRFMETYRIPIKFIPEIWVKMKTGGTTNKNLRNIWKQNREIWNALNQHKLYPSLIEFTVGKLISRTSQYLSRP